MWKLKIGDQGGGSRSSPLMLKTVNGYLGRQEWVYEYDPANLGTPAEEIASEIDKAREDFHVNRFHHHKHSSDDLLMRIQFSKENPCACQLPQVKVKELGDLTEDNLAKTLKRAINFYSTLQAHDGHWPGDYGGPMFLMFGLVTTLSITGALNELFPKNISVRCADIFIITRIGMVAGVFTLRDQVPCLAQSQIMSL